MIDRPGMPMPRHYSNAEYQSIASALGVPLEHVMAHMPEFEAAVSWYRSSERSPLPRTPSEMRKKAKQISGAARRLLHHLGIDDPRQAADGPGIPWILDLLAYGEGVCRETVVDATKRVGRLAEVLDGIAATGEIEGYGHAAVPAIKRLGEVLGIGGHRGDLAEKLWLEAMMSLYEKITGERPRMTVGAAGTDREGEARGRFIDFLKAAGRPLGIKINSDAWRSKARTVLAETSQRQN